ncbi:hypothetical protein JNK13_05845 [bacterium]|nr:hypothetical protein [bacterium]
MKSKRNQYFFLMIVWFLSGSVLQSLADQRGTAELRICSQNLHNFKVFERKQYEREATKLKALVERMTTAQCDVIGVQEVGSPSYRLALKNLEALASQLQKTSGDSYKAVVAESIRSPITVGFLVREKAATITGTIDYSKQVLPKLSVLGKPHTGNRGPLLLRLKVPGKNQKPSRPVSLITIHFKSRHDGFKDRSGTNFETLRMEMAEGVRQLAENEVKNLDSSGIVLILGDRNSEEDSAAAQILTGKLLLSDFQSPQHCLLTRDQDANCNPRIDRTPKFVPIFAEKKKRISGSGFGSIRYNGRVTLIDEILIEAADRDLFTGQDRQLSGDFIGIFGKGSDHKLLVSELNW